MSALHRCTSTGCSYLGQPSPETCSCHLTNEQVLAERQTRLADLLEAAMEEVDRHADEGHPHWWTDAEHLLAQINPAQPQMGMRA